MSLRFLQTAWGILQVTPGDGADELNNFKQHSTTTNTLSWDPSSSGAGTLIDWKTKQTIDLNSLSNQDLLRPWINIHVAQWIQSNEARTGSADPGDWSNLLSQSKNGGRLSGINTGMGATLATALGTWVAGPNADDGFQTSGDNGSGDYINQVFQGVQHLYNGQAPSLYEHKVKQGLVDYH